MKTSARNQFPGKVASVKEGSVNDEVELDIGSGQRIFATVTRESRDLLALKPGQEAVALVKASSVIVFNNEGDFVFSARNILGGTVAKLTPGAVNSEVVIDLAGGNLLTAIVTNDSARALGLAVGKPASAMFKVSNVILGVRK